VKIGKSALLILAYNEYTVKKSSVFEWHRQFKEAQEDLQDDPRNGHPESKGQIQVWAEYEPRCPQIED
jgi:hypothetical protein